MTSDYIYSNRPRYPAVSSFLSVDSFQFGSVKMHRIRRPWPVSRRDTDGVQTNTLGGEGEKGAQTTATDVNGDSARNASRAEDDLRKFNALHEWDPNLSGKE
jgi:hypothetical protein